MSWQDQLKPIVEKDASTTEHDLEERLRTVVHGSGSLRQSSSSCVRRTSTSRLPTWFAAPTIPSFSICSINRAARL
jgi:hypothetical protein